MLHGFNLFPETGRLIYDGEEWLPVPTGDAFSAYVAELFKVVNGYPFDKEVTFDDIVRLMSASGEQKAQALRSLPH